MKLKKILLIICLIYISAYSRDILQYQSIMNDRNLNIPLESTVINTNTYKVSLSREEKINIDKELNKASKLIEDGKFFEVITLCNELEINYTNYYPIYYFRGLSYFREGDLYYASIDFKKLLSLK